MGFEELENFQVKLQALGNKMEKQGTLFTPVVGQLVMMKSVEDNQWYRGTVIKIHKTKAKIYCPDFGFVEKVPMNMLQSIKDTDVIRAKYWASHCAWWIGGKESRRQPLKRKTESRRHWWWHRRWICGLSVLILLTLPLTFLVSIDMFSDSETVSWNLYVIFVFNTIQLYGN